VFRNGVQIGWSLFEFDDPARRLQYRVLTRLAGTPSAVDGTEAPRWMLLTDEAQPVVPGDRLLEGVSVPAGFLEELQKAVTPGTTLVVTQLPASGDTTGMDLNVVVAEQAGGA
jgi:hypothetical protein